ncbi:MAG: hypothetical protein DRQ51_02975 [Gammaproteobacteria bacterium]|nr:MAG: hypothetical protein DRQ51_02975 [Gammaproteobacteria bacterium]
MISSNLKFNKITIKKPEITMAPLIDVVFLLLIFFVVSTVFPENRGLIIEKPATRTAENLSLKKISFQLDATGNIHFKNQKINKEDVARLIKEQLQSDKDTAILIITDKKTPTGDFVALMDICKTNGATKIAIATTAITDEPVK